jgi:hypothetical protein
MKKKRSSSKIKKKSSAQIIQQSKENLELNRALHNNKVTKNLDLFVYWTSLALLALFNLIACFFLIPFLMFFDGFYLYLSVTLFGLMFGLLFNFLIIGLEHLDDHHMVIAGIFIPLLAVVDIVIILRITEKINDILKTSIEYDVSMIIIIFITAFVLPYLATVIAGKHKI